MPFVSIIVPVFNSEVYLSNCIESILNQSFNDFELLLIDNDSTDSSIDVCKRYALRDKRVKVFCQPLRGPSNARNMGLDNAQGEYVLFTDSDDCLKENYISSFVDAKENYPECNNIWCGYISLPNYNSIDTSAAEVFGDKEYYVIDRKKYMKLFDQMFCQPLWNKLYKNSIIQENNIRMKNDLYLGEDIIFGLEYLDKSGEEIVFVNKTTYMYINSRRGSLTHQYHKNREVFSYTINRNLINYMKKWELPPDDLSLAYASAFYRFESTMKGIYNNELKLSKRERKKRCRSIMKSPEFRDALKYGSYKVNPLQKAGYKLCSYTIVHMYDKLYRLKKKRKKR